MSLSVLMGLYLLGGVVAGLTSGLLGLGGGLVIVPFLAWLLPYSGLPPDRVMHVAVATSLVFIMCTSASSLFAHIRKRAVSWRIFTYLLPGLICGALIGTMVADSLSNDTLRILFGLFTLIMVFSIVKKKDGVIEHGTDFHPSYWFSLFGLLIGILSNVLGIGGGSLVLPLLNQVKLSMRTAIATASACAFPTALSGVISLFIRSGDPILIFRENLGHLYAIMFLLMTLASVLSAQVGAYYAHRLPSNRLRQIFAGFLILVSIRMLYQTIQHFF